MKQHRSNYSHNLVVKIITGLFCICMVGMLILYYNGYDNSIGWEVTTEASVDERTSLIFENHLHSQEISVATYSLAENYSGTAIEINKNFTYFLLLMAWVGVCIVLTSVSFFHRIIFVVQMGLLALFFNYLKLDDVTIFGMNTGVSYLFFLLFLLPLVYFHEFNKTVVFWKRLLVLLGISAVLLSGIGDPSFFTSHFIAHSVFGFAFCGILFLFFVSDEIGFFIVFISTSGNKQNSNHFFLLSIIYIGNLILCYLDKSGIYRNSISYYDPFVLLIISSSVLLWSVRYKSEYYQKITGNNFWKHLVLGLGIILFSILGLSMFIGNDAFYQSFYYLVLYFHLAFGFFFVLYTIGNFLDPMVKGLPVYKIIFKERNFPLVTAKLGAIVGVLGLFLYSNNIAYRLLDSSHYAYLGDTHELIEEDDLSQQYYLNANFMGRYTHYPNYRLASSNLTSKDDAMIYYEQATLKYPSAFAYVNFANLQKNRNQNKSIAYLEKGLDDFSSGEIANNLAMMYLENGDDESALSILGKFQSSESWNQSPLLNKWCILAQRHRVDSASLVSDWARGNIGVKANILATLSQVSLQQHPFDTAEFLEAPLLHQQSYLLNRLSLGANEKLLSSAKKHLSNSLDASFNNRLKKSLAIQLYKNGYVNQTFRMVDNLQANAHNVILAGEHLHLLALIAMQQGAYRVALDLLSRAMESNDDINIKLSYLETLIALGKRSEVAPFLFKILDQNQDYTVFANKVLEDLDSIEISNYQHPVVEIENLSQEELIKVAKKNAFDVNTILKIIQKLEKSHVQEAYDVLIQAVEINPFSSDLLKAYILSALDLGLNDYAKIALSKMQDVSKEDFENFKKIYEHKIRTNDVGWE